ncbi:M14 family metallopeptidase [Marinospirillum sp.]|uniref:M14 family metallopeptidase n=1 Tax=Marinospirillum sp. TaxID=2183934 RepID=UPI0028707500|nr:M14 family metallopeptidase [Marinospirillum sp.]MDR9467535.1 M14 family metallopeptidase [Marinospirillum sp.]
MPTFFQPTYRQARQQFLRAAAEQPLNTWQTARIHPLKGREDEELALDALWLGPRDAEHLLVVQSATHGVEGFAGSAVQAALLNQKVSLPNDTALLLLHAMNPWGFSFQRRVDEQGIDLNRNFVDFAHLPENPGYVELASALIPASWNPQALEVADQQLEAYRQQYGETAYEVAVSGGQYTHPEGLFYGGQAPSWSRLQLQALAEELELEQRKAVAILDVHTGLGDYAVGEVICDHPPGSQGVRWARRWYGEAVTEPLLGTSSSVPKQGLIDFFWHQLLPERCSFVTLEFGTGPTSQLFHVLRGDHWLAQQPLSRVDSAQSLAIQQALLEHFSPSASDWREAVIAQGLQRIDQALKGLAE